MFDIPESIFNGIRKPVTRVGFSMLTEWSFELLLKFFEYSKLFVQIGVSMVDKDLVSNYLINMFGSLSKPVLQTGIQLVLIRGYQLYCEFIICINIFCKLVNILIIISEY